MEKRKASRVVKKLEVKFHTPVEKTAITSDLSEVGMFIRTNMGMTSGSVVNFRLNLPSAEELSLNGKITRSVRTMLGLIGESKSGMGVQLIDPPDDYKNYVQSLLSPVNSVKGGNNR